MAVAVCEGGLGEASGFADGVVESGVGASNFDF
jgi:hypothetical protein